MTVILTKLFAPADRVDRAHKAMATTADIVILDLEDAVAPTAKGTARAAAPDIVAAHPGRLTEIRVNAVPTPWSKDDLAMVAGLPGHVAVAVPKVESPADVAAVAAIVGERPLHCLLETAVGVEAAAEIARAPGVASIALGEADLSSDLGVTADDALEWCRQRLVVAARAAGLPPPLASVHTRLGDLDDLAESTRQARRRGFVGRLAIHPKQLPVIEAAFRPSDDEVKRAREVIASVESAKTVGDGTSVLADGSFLDVAMIEQARRVLALANRTANVTS